MRSRVYVGGVCVGGGETLIRDQEGSRCKLRIPSLHKVQWRWLQLQPRALAAT
jgi:hypothetical protein